MEYKTSRHPVGYQEAVAYMEDRVQTIRAAGEDELVWLLEHPPLYTAGTSARDSDLLDSHGLPVYKTGRGGQYTYHGPGQRVAYVMLDLKKRTPDVRLFVKNLAEVIILTLAELGIKGEMREGRVGVWVASDESRVASREEEVAGGEWQVARKVRGYAEESYTTTPRSEGVARKRVEGELHSPPYNNKLYKESKIASIGIRIRQWVTYHGIAINVNPDLEHYRGIIPCGITEYGVTSLERLGVVMSMEEFDKQFLKSFNTIF